MKHKKPEKTEVSKIEHHNSGADMWDEYKADYGVTEARGICNRYLDMQINSKNPEELRFCKELYAAMENDPAVQETEAKRKESLLARLDDSKKEVVRSAAAPKEHRELGPDL